MIVSLGPITRTKPRFKGDRLVYRSADLIVDGLKIGTVHTNGHAPKWAYQINPYRWRAENIRYADQSSDSRSKFHGLLFDGAAYDSAEIARGVVEKQLTRFEALKREQP